MNLNRLLAILIAVLLLGAAGLWVRAHVEVKRETHVIPPALYVRADQYYALAHVLAPAVTVKRYADVSKIDLAHSGFIAVDGSALEKLGKARLTKWVARGGRLLITMPTASDAPARSWWHGSGPFEGLAPRFEKVSSKTGQSPKAPKKSEPKSSSRRESTARKLVVLVDTTVSFPHAVRDRATSVVTYDGVTKIAVRYWGKGQVIVCGAPRFLTNRDLETDDDLRFAGSLFGGLMAHPGGVAWLPSPPLPSVSSTQRIEVGPILAAAMVIFLLLVWMKSPRFGPVLPEPDEDNRSLRTRFRAEGRFLWKYGAGGWIVDRLRGAWWLRGAASSDPFHEARAVDGPLRRFRNPTRREFIREVGELAHHLARSLERRRAGNR